MRDNMSTILSLLGDHKHCNATSPNLGLDEACLQVVSTSSNPVDIFSLSEECDKDLGSPLPPDMPAAIARSDFAPVVIKKGRVKSLDVFRGFLWIMGTSIAISLRSQLRSCLSRKRLFLRVLQRSIILVVLGIILNTGGIEKTNFANLRIPGVLQRIGLSYFIVGSIETVFMKPMGSFEYGRYMVMVRDILDCWVQWIVILCITAAHVLLTFLLHVPGCPTGYLGPGGWHNHSSSPNCTGGAAGYIDRLVFGNNHIYQNPTSRKVFQSTVPYDPEGLLGTLSSVLLVFMGVQAGRVILTYHYTYQRITRWIGWAVFVVGILMVLISMNSITMYIGHEITRSMMPWSWKPINQSHEEFLAMNLWGTTLWMLIAYVMYERKVFITL
ncbi:Heparan-alpha-glucosaminide N-acetyltransferase [Blattella germanica]|nr:Heparan-alpha-glucosaminide N-acetyltransferase [Blattella germanica]